MTAEFKVRTFFNIKYAPGYKDAVVEVSPKLRRLLCDKLINIKWQRVQPRDYISIMQCYQCYDFGHKAAECKFTQKCGKCAGDHEFKKCTADKICCIICKRANEKVRDNQNKVNTEHDTKSKDCPTVKRIKNAIVQSIDYYG